MHDTSETQKRYFSVQMERCFEKPGLHRHKIEDCRYYMKALDEAGSPASFRDFVQRTGKMISTGKAEALDRYENRISFYEALGQEEKVKANREGDAIILGANTHQELAVKHEEFETDRNLELPLISS